MEGAYLDHAKNLQNNLQNNQLLVDEVGLLFNELTSMKIMMTVTPTPTELP